MNTVLVIGPCSMLGTHLCKLLRERGVQVLTAGWSTSDDILLDLEAELASLLNAGLKANTVFHCAANCGSDANIGVAANFQTNTGSAWHVAALCKALGARKLAYAGTVSSSYAATDRANYNSYGSSKALGEQVLEWSLGKSGVGFASLRFSQLYYTEGRCCKHQAWFCRIVAYAARGQNLRLPVSHGSRNFLHVSDAAEFMIWAGERDELSVMDILYPEFLTCNELAEMAYSIFGRGGKVISTPEKQPLRKVGFPEESGATFGLLARSPRIYMQAGLHLIKDQDTWMALGLLDVQ